MRLGFGQAWKQAPAKARERQREGNDGPGTEREEDGVAGRRYRRWLRTEPQDGDVTDPAAALHCPLPAPMLGHSQPSREHRDQAAPQGVLPEEHGAS